MRLPACLLLASLPSGCSRAAPEEAPRAVVLITCDTLRQDHLGCYGAPRETTPHLDRLAAESVVYDSAWSTAPLTGPALSALLTGRPPEELGLEDNQKVLSGEAVTLAERLAREGIATAAVVSNWVLRRRAEIPAAGVQQGFEHFDERMETVEPARPDLKERLAPDTTQAALEWLEAHLSGPERTRPFFLWVHYQDPHGPYTPPAEFVRPPEPSDEGELLLGEDHRGRGVLPAYQAVDGERRPEVFRARYEGEIRFFDREFGRLLAGLERHGVLARSLLLFSADHGESLGERGYYFSHGQHLHSELLRVPLLVRPPGGLPEPHREPRPVSHLDLFPSVLAFFGLAKGPTRGRDLLADGPWPERVLPGYLRGGISATDATHRLIAERGAPRLYDLVQDPREEHDLAAEQPTRVRALLEGHRAFLHSVGLAPLRAAEPGLDAESQRGLEALGYGGHEEE